MYKCKKLFTGDGGGAGGGVPPALGNRSGAAPRGHVTPPSFHSKKKPNKTQTNSPPPPQKKSRGKPGWLEMGVGIGPVAGGAGCCPQTMRCVSSPHPTPPPRAPSSLPNARTHQLRGLRPHVAVYR